MSNVVQDEEEDDNSMGSEIIPKLSDTDEDTEERETITDGATGHAVKENGPTTGRKTAATVPLDLTCV